MEAEVQVYLATVGDKNTKYFHQRASQRRRKNHIHGFLDENGWWVTSKYDIARVVESYFQNILESVVEVVDRVVTPDTNQALLQPYTLKE